MATTVTANLMAKIHDTEDESELLTLLELFDSVPGSPTRPTSLPAMEAQ